MPDICALLPNKLSNRPCIPSNLHSQRCAQKPEAKSTNGAPSKRQKILLAPRIEVITTPSPAPEDEMLFGHNNDMNNSPVSDDTQECLESRLGEEPSRTAADDNCGDEAERDEDDARDVEGPGAEVLGVHGEGVVVWDIVLRHVSHDGESGRGERTGMELNAANTMRNFPKPPAGSTDAVCEICVLPGSITLSS